MIVIGLTGGIATGKSTTAALFAERGVPIHDADAAVHRLLGPTGGAVELIVARFGADMLMDSGGIDRQKLGLAVFSNTDDRRALEKILHPLVAADRNKFLAEQQAIKTLAVVLDVPLLFETGGETLCDLVVVAAADPPIQASRAMARPGMTQPKLDGIIASQMCLSDKIKNADFVVNTQTGIDEARRQVFAWLDQILQDEPLKGDDGAIDA